MAVATHQIQASSSSAQEIENSNRFMEPNPDENPLMVDLLWSDPKGFLALAWPVGSEQAKWSI